MSALEYLMTYGRFMDETDHCSDCEHHATHIRFDPTYEAQCDKLRAKGYTIINNTKKETQK